ncbi:helix-turn-helix domain-containing protein [Paenibacillus sp. FSL K6-3166]|uniref:helix-turn-helix domain-containing protein n=1 Tax=Paenibacillus sp. FSL K6-3166 TaxID=2921492 RepID=UPI0030F8B8B0
MKQQVVGIELSSSEQYELNRNIILGFLRMKKKILVVGPLASGKTFLLEFLKKQSNASEFLFIDSIYGYEEYSPLVSRGGVVAAAQTVGQVCRSLDLSCAELISKIDIVVQTDQIGTINIIDAKLFNEDENDFEVFIRDSIVFTDEAAQILECTIQNVHKMIKDGKITPIKQTSNATLFLRKELMSLKKS